MSKMWRWICVVGVYSLRAIAGGIEKCLVRVQECVCVWLSALGGVRCICVMWDAADHHYHHHHHNGRGNCTTDIYLGWCARLYFGFIPTELWHHWRRRLTHPLISPAPVPRRPPDSSDQQCSSPDHRCDCPCHRYVWLSDPTSSGTYPARSAKDFVPDKEKTGRAGNWGVGRCGVCMLFLLLYCVLGSWQKWKTHINRQLLHILWIHIAVQRVVLIQITVHFVAHISHLSVCFLLFSYIKVQNLLFFLLFCFDFCLRRRLQLDLFFSIGVYTEYV